MSLATIKDATSTSVGTDDLGSVFDETIASFERLRERAEELIVKQVRGLRPGEGDRMLERTFSERVCKALRRRVADTPGRNLGPSRDEDDDEDGE